jgi:hypothetical protein
MFAATSLAGGQEQLQRMLDLLMDAVSQSPDPPTNPDPPRKSGR